MLYLCGPFSFLKMKSIILTYCFVLSSSLINTNLNNAVEIPSADLLPNISIEVEVPEELTVENLYAEMKKVNIKHADVVLRQAILETGWFRSYSCRERNNLFGFWYKKKYIEFSSWKASVEYYKKWQERHYKDDKQNYYDFLIKRGYAEDPKYIGKLKSIKVEKYVK